MKKTKPFRYFVLATLAGLLCAACSPDSPEEKTTAQDVTITEAAPAVEAAAVEPPAQAAAELPDVVVLYGLEEMIPWLESEDWWGPENHDQQLTVPHVIITAIHPSWKEASANIPVRQKKELFYRLMLPLVMHANSMVLEFRGGLERAREEYAADGRISEESLALLHRTAPLLPGMTVEDAQALAADDADMESRLDDLLYRLDVVPAGLALGQAAYESGYGTSRFATEGNSLFGQWTYKGDGIVPGQQRKSSKGDHRVKAFDWPFDSVRGYFINLMTHRAYEDFRRMRADLRAAGKPLASLVLADSLVHYSERGQEYVDSLKGIIRVNKLQIADDAVFRDEPLRFLLSEDSQEKVEEVQAAIERMRDSGELAEIIERMRLQ